MREAMEVQTEGVGEEDPADHGQHRTRQAGGEALFQVWGQEIEQYDCDHHKTHCQDVAQYRPQQREDVRQAKMAGEKFSEAWADLEEHERQRHQGRGNEQEFERQQARLPEWPGFRNIVGDIEGFDNLGEPAGAGPERADKAEREQSAATGGNDIGCDPANEAELSGGATLARVLTMVSNRSGIGR